MTVPLLDLHAQHATIREELDAAVARVFDHGRFVQGPEVGEFEDAFAGFCDAKACVGVANGTVALELVLRAAGIGPGDEVVTTPFTFIATVEPILAIGARPVLADVDGDTGLLTVDAVTDAVTERTAALVPVHLYGQTVDLDAFRALADRRGLFLLEDAAQAHGARWRGRRAGSIGDAATFSFFPGKNLGALGDAGAVTTRNAELAERIRKVRDHGRIDKYRHDELGTNARLDTLQAAVLAVKLRHLEEWNEARRAQASAYDRALTDVPAVRPIRVDAGAEPVYHQYVVRVSNRDAVRATLVEQGIGAAVHYPVPLHRQPALSTLAELSFPAAERLADEVLSLPIYPELEDAQRERVVTALARATEGSRSGAPAVA